MPIHSIPVNSTHYTISVRACLALSLFMWGASCLRAGEVTYIYADPQGTPLAEADSVGNVTATFEYRPYGNIAMGQTPDGLGYTGHVNEADSGLVYMQARFYDPRSGRFLSIDPVGAKAGDVYSAGSYDYAKGNPVRYIDPDGRYACGTQDKRVCAKIDRFVAAMNRGLTRLPKDSGEYRSLRLVSEHIGTAGDNNGVTLRPGSLERGVVAQADTAALMTVDVNQASTLSAPFLPYNKGMSAANLAKAFGGGAVAHEGQHQLDYKSSGYPTDRTSEHKTEMNAYRTEIGVAKGLGVSTDLYAPGALQKDIDERIKEGADTSTNLWCEKNGC